MSAATFLLSTLAVFLGLSAGMMLVAVEPPVSTLESGLGPVVETAPL